MKAFIAVSLAALVLVLVALGSGAYNMAVTEKHWAITEKLITWVREGSIKARAKDLKVPTFEFEEEDMLAKGFAQYHAMCTGCHLTPGKQPSELAVGLYPQAPLFYERAPVINEEDKLYLFKKYFWVIKHGIKMTAMPAWGSTHDDESIWTMAAFILTLHGMTDEQYAALVDTHFDKLEQDSHHH